MAESGFTEGCCWNTIREHCPGQECRCRCHVVYPERKPGRDRATLLEVVKDLRTTALAHRKSAEVAPTRIERKHQNEIADILAKRADFYDLVANA